MPFLAGAFGEGRALVFGLGRASSSARAPSSSSVAVVVAAGLLAAGGAVSVSSVVAPRDEPRGLAAVVVTVAVPPFCVRLLSFLSTPAVAAACVALAFAAAAACAAFLRSFSRCLSFSSSP